MDVIRGLKETAIEKINMPTLAALIPELDNNKAEIDKFERKEFKYAEGNRHYLDVYYPHAASALSTPNGKLPVLFFIYGGGYNTGSRRFPEPYDMGYRALGSFFAARGFLVVIPDYRLVPEARFPSASEDIRDALLWVAGHAGEVASGATEAKSVRNDLDPAHVFILAHSAGVAHTLVLHSYPPLRTNWDEKKAEVGLNVRGLLLSGGPWDFGVRGEAFMTTGPASMYFGSVAQQKQRAPRALWAAMGDEDVRGFPDVMLIQAEREPDWLRVGTRDVMEKEMRERLDKVGRTLDETYIAAGHNHISVNWVLGTGHREGEKWGYQVAEWIKARL